MARPNADKLVAAILQSPEAAGWAKRLTADFFEDSAKRKVIAEIRAGVTAAAASSPEDLIAAAQKAVLGQLIGQASRDAVPPAAESEPADLLSGSELEDRVIEAYPFPIAVAFRAMVEQSSGAGGFGCLLDAFESLVHFLASVAVSAYLRSAEHNPDCDRFLVDLFAKGTWSTGDMMALLRETVRLGGSGLANLPYARLPGYLFTPQGKPTASLRVLESFVTLRNRSWGHGTGRDEKFYASLLPANRMRLEQELARLNWLTSWQLIRPTQIDDTGHIQQADVLMGDRRRKGRAYDVRLAQADLDHEGGCIQTERTLLLVDPATKGYLPLFPLTTYQFQLSSEGVYFLQRLQWQPHQRRLRRAAYVAYQSGLDEHEELPGNLAVRVLEGHLDRLTNDAAAAAPPVASAADDSATVADADHELAQVRHEQEFHIQRFAGRETTLREIEAWLDEPAATGYLLLVGPPGQGKSALAAQLAARAGQRGGCLLHMVKSHRSPKRFVPALVSQAAKLAQAQFGESAYQPESADDMSNILSRALEAVRDKTGRAVFVIDGLDQVSEGEGLDFLPSELPPGVKGIVTCRPELLLLAGLRSRLRRLKEFTLPPMAESELRQVIEHTLQREGRVIPPDAVDWRAVIRRIDGSPLLLERALTHILREARTAADGVVAHVDLASLPASFDDLFQDIYAEIGERQGTRFTTTEGRHKARILQIMSGAREPLNLPQLVELLACDGTSLGLDECRNRVSEMSPYLLDAGSGRLQIWHPGLADYVRQQILGTGGCRQLEALFCTWLERPIDQQTNYGLRYRASHLLAAGEFDPLEDLCTDFAYLEARVQSGMIHELSAELASVARALPSDRPRQRIVTLLSQAMRTDLPSIVSAPATLFQALWNRCWWHDTQEAAGAIVPPARGWSDGQAPWEHDGPRLNQLLEDWRASRAADRNDEPWLRALLPVFDPLGGPLQAAWLGHRGEIRAVAYSHDGRLAAAGAEDGSVRVWDAHGDRIVSRCAGPPARVLALAFSLDGERLASAAEDGSLTIWDWARGAAANQHRCEPAGRAAAFSADGRWLATTDGQQICLWDAATVERLAAHDLPRSIASCLAASSQQKLAVGLRDGGLAVWNATQSEPVLVPNHTAATGGLAFSPDGRFLAAAALDGLLRCWDLESHAQRWSQRGDGRLLCVAWSDDNKRLAAGTQRGEIRLHNDTGQTLSTLRGHEGSVNALAFSPTGRTLISGGFDHVVRQWDSDDAEPPGTLADHLTNVSTIALAGSERLLVGHPSGAVDLVNWSRLSHCTRLEGHRHGIRALASSWDGRRLASGSDGGVVRMWDAARGQQTACLTGHQAPVRALAFSSESRLILSGSEDQTVRVWFVADGSLMTSLGGLNLPVLAVAISPDGKQVAAGLAEGRIAWGSLTPGRGWRFLEGHESSVLGLAFSPDSRRLASRSLDRTTRLWDLTSGNCIERIAGLADVHAVAAGGRYRALSTERETLVQEAATLCTVASVPWPLQQLVTDCDGQRFAGIHAGRLSAYVVEELTSI